MRCQFLLIASSPTWLDRLHSLNLDPIAVRPPVEFYPARNEKLSFKFLLNLVLYGCSVPLQIYILSIYCWREDKEHLQLEAAKQFGSDSVRVRIILGFFKLGPFRIRIFSELG
ncbi:hypothetical protein V6N11_067193 [Hibiscus sabdariffa]|uniref:Uncharacterized protein n=1 Tax=Hibiscus sabdariffa TaxID=183260 RepID=A0ABR2SQ46_9ROSI